MTLRHAFAMLCCGTMLMRCLALDRVCAAEAVDAEGACPEEPSQSLLQHRYKAAENILISDAEVGTDSADQGCPGGILAANRCWLLGAVGQNCDDTCASRNLSYSYAKPAEDMTPLLVGHTPAGVQDPWLFVECYVATEDRYHPMNPNAWGVPSKTPAGELPTVGSFKYETCRLACPCAAVPGAAKPTPVKPNTMPAVPDRVPGCSGTFKNGRCWYLSKTGDSCDNTCNTHGQGCNYSFARPPAEDMMPLLIGHVPRGKQAPWLFVECYVGQEDRYHPYSPTAWGVPAQTDAGELARVGQFKYETCRLACPCGGTCSGAVPIVPEVPVPVPVVPVPQPGVPSQVLTNGRCEGGVVNNDRCWYLSGQGDSCSQTCAGHGCAYGYSEPQGDIMPQLVGHVPQSKDAPWLFVECYVPAEDRYHPINPNAWGVPSITPSGDAGKPAQFKYETCRLACPCQGQCLFTVGTTMAPLPFPVPLPVPIPAPVPAPAPIPAPAPYLMCEDGVGISSVGRCWYLSDTGANCDDTCAARGFGYMYAAPPTGDMVPHFVGHEENLKQDPWLFVECYVPQEDRYHPASQNAWGVPAKTPADELLKTGQYTYETCQLSCPCAGAPPVAPLPPVQPVQPVTPVQPQPPVQPVAPAPIRREYDMCTGVPSEGRCWYLSAVGGSCDETCGAHGTGCQYSYAQPIEDITPMLIGHTPAGKQNPWLFAECYVGQEDRYHPVNPNAWGVPSKTPVADLAKVGNYRYETCMLACPCAGTCAGVAPAPLPVPVPVPVAPAPQPMPQPVPVAPLPQPIPQPVPQPIPQPVPVPVPVPSPVPVPGWSGKATGNGMEAEGRAWYMSEKGASCKDTCATAGLMFSWAAPPVGGVVTPRLLGRDPAVRQEPWAFVECYVPEEDRYHEVNRNAWGVPHKTLASEVPKAASWSHEECQLACPCIPATAEQCRWEQPPACAQTFEWRGHSYSGCPTVDHDTPWCQHHHHHSKTDNVADPVDWSECIYTCDEKKDIPTPGSNCAWQSPTTCSGEFNYEGALVMGCTAADHHSPWCSNTAVYSGSWSHCQYHCESPTAADLKTIEELNKWADAETEVCNWQPAEACKQEFEYKDTEYTGCAFFVDSPTPWCSHDRVHNGAWSSCERVCRSPSTQRQLADP